MVDFPQNPMMADQGMGEGDTAPMMSSDQMKGDLQRMVDDLKKKRGRIKTDSYMEQNKLSLFKTKMIKDFFKTLESMGVNPADPVSVSQFVQNMERQDPDLVRLLEMVLGSVENNMNEAEAGQPAMEGMEMDDGSGDGAILDRYRGLRSQIL